MKRSTENKKPDPIPHEQPRSIYRRDDFHVQAHYPGDAGRDKDFLREEDDESEKPSKESQ